MLEKLPGAPSCAIICSSVQASLGWALSLQTPSLCLIAVVSGGLSCMPSTFAGSPGGRASFDPAEKKRAIITSKKRKQEK